MCELLVVIKNNFGLIFRQDLERVRNLCYMIGRREKTKRASVKNMESVFLTQVTKSNILTAQ